MVKNNPATVISIKQALSDARLSGIDQIDSEALLCFVLNKTRSFLYTWPESNLSAEQLSRYSQLLHQRQQGQPVAYLIGYKEFYSRNFKVNNATLIPRPETELLIDLCLDWYADKKPIEILELGTGSGIISITLKKELGEKATLNACDLSNDAIKVAQENAKKHRAEVTFFRSNWFESIEPKAYDLIISNPPYIEEQDQHLKKGDLRFEPLLALKSGKDGLDAIKTIISQAPKYLKTGGRLLFEHGFDQKTACQKLLKQQGFDEIGTFLDYAGLDRVSTGIKTD